MGHYVILGLGKAVTVWLLGGYATDGMTLMPYEAIRLLRPLDGPLSDTGPSIDISLLICLWGQGRSVTV